MALHGIIDAAGFESAITGHAGIAWGIYAAAGLLLPIYSRVRHGRTARAETQRPALP